MEDLIVKRKKLVASVLQKLGETDGVWDGININGRKIDEEGHMRSPN